MVQASRRDARKLTSAAFRGLKPHGYPQQTTPRSAHARLRSGLCHEKSQIRAFPWAKATRLPSIYRNAMGPKSALFPRVRFQQTCVNLQTYKKRAAVSCGSLRF